MTSPAAGNLRWSVVILDFDPIIGHEQAGVRRALVVSSNAFHRSGLATVCPLSERAAKYPGEVSIGLGEAGQTLAAVILCHQVRTVALRRVTSYVIGGQPQVLRDPSVRREVRAALAHHLGLDLRAELDGAA
jgi:mRNA interferase MazF